MEGEINNFIAVWITVLASLCYCHTIAKLIPKGTTRLFTILPIVLLFLYLPLHLTTIHLGATTAFFTAWLANFKLLLFAYGKPPLSSNPPIKLRRFILLACLPIKIQHHPSPEKKSQKSPLNYAAKILLLAILIQVYSYKEHLHPQLLMVLYCIHMYLALEIFMEMMAALARALVRLELDPQFDEPYLSTSLQDFWGRRWNLMVTRILHPTVYNPVRSVAAGLIGRKWASLPAVLATFFISGVMHELIFYYVIRLRPTFEVTCFFLIHGLCLAAEIGFKKKKAFSDRSYRVPTFVSGPMVVIFVVGTGLWLFFPPVIRGNGVAKAWRETAAIAEFVKKLFGG